MTISNRMSRRRTRQQHSGCPIAAVRLGLAIVTFLVASRATTAQKPEVLHPEVKAAIPRDFPPQYSVNQSGEPAGFAIDVMEAVAARAGVRVRYLVFDTWREVQEAVRSGQADVIPNTGITPTRDRELDFTTPMETFSGVIFVRSSTTDIRGIEDLASERVGVVRTNMGADLMRNIPEIDPVIFDDVRTALFELLAGRMKAIIYPEPVVRKMAQEAGLDDRIQVVGNPLWESRRAIAVRQGETALLSRLDDAANRFVGSKEYQRIYRKWYGAPRPFWTSERIVWTVGGVFVVTFAGMWIWRYRSLLVYNRRLQSSIARLEETEGELRESEGKFRSLFENAPIAMLLVSDDDTFVDVNPAMCELVGYHRDELIGRSVSEVTTGRERERILLAPQGGPEDGAALSGEGSYVHKDGHLVPVRVSLAIVEDAHGAPRYVIGQVQDLTEIKSHERELVRLERLRALGEMSAGISHNLNNILTSVVGPAQLLKRSTEDPDVLLEVDSILEAAIRAQNLIQQLALSTRGTTQEAPQPVQINDVVLEAVQGTRSRWKDEREATGNVIEVATELADVPAVRCSPTAFFDVTLNLILNAVDAMPEGGVISIRTEQVDGGVRITVEDSGQGMDEAVRERVFEPFFTTKMDVGSGLGLATAYNAVNQWGGHIDVESTLGKGTTFSVWLPAWSGDVSTKEVEGESIDRVVRQANLLIVDDDGDVCQFLSRVFGDRHNLTTFRNGREALEKGFAPGRFDVALIDLGIPGMPGDRLAHEMHQMDRSLVTVLITGWDLDREDSRWDLFDLRIQKPFSDINALVDLVAQAVELHDTRVLTARQSG